MMTVSLLLLFAFFLWPEVFAKTLFSVYELVDQQGACAGFRQIYL